jgi:hypothetical protein
MAFQKDQELENGFTGNYWRLSSVQGRRVSGMMLRTPVESVV